MSTYTLISSDSHIIEPADLWETRIDRRFRDRAPRLMHEGEVDQWHADGVKFGNIGTNQQAGLRFEAPDRLTAGGSMKTVPLGGVDPHAHIKDMDVDGVAGGVLYPSQGLTVYRVPDGELLSAIFRAYNDWLADFCHLYPKRLKGIAMLNVDEPAVAASELRRAATIGLAGAMILLRPMEQRYDHPMYEPLWAAAQDLDMPLSLHVGTYRWRPGTNPNVVAQDIVDFTNRECDARNAIAAMIYAGVFERYPTLRMSGRVRGGLGPTSWHVWTMSTLSALWGGNCNDSKMAYCPAISSGGMSSSASRRTTSASSSVPLSVCRT